MTDEEKVKDVLIEVANRHKSNFNFSIDLVFNSIINEARHLLYSKYPDNPYLSHILESIVRYITIEIVNYSKSRFESSNLDIILTNIQMENVKQFDEQFLDYIDNQIESESWINPVEKRLYDLLKNKTTN